MGAPDPLTASTVAQVTALRSPGSVALTVLANSRTLDADDVDAAVERYGEEILRQPQNESVTMRPADDGSRWDVGHEAVIEETWERDAWVPRGVDRMFRLIDPQRVLSRTSSEIHTELGLLLLGAAAEPWPGRVEEGRGIPFDRIQPGDVVAGIGYSSSDGRATEVARLVVEQPS